MSTQDRSSPILEYISDAVVLSFSTKPAPELQLFMANCHQAAAHARLEHARVRARKSVFIGTALLSWMLIAIQAAHEAIQRTSLDPFAPVVVMPVILVLLAVPLALSRLSVVRRAITSIAGDEDHWATLHAQYLYFLGAAKNVQVGLPADWHPDDEEE